jgi:DNA-binding CsgD family transcriptional regulator
MRSIQTDSFPVYIFGKDEHGKFMFCNELFAEASGADSPSHIIGKTDFQMCWRKYAALYRKGDMAAMVGDIYQGVREKQTHIDAITYNIVVNKYPFFDKNHKIRGVIGSFTKVPLKKVDAVSIKTTLECEENKIYLGPGFGNEYFTKREYDVFQQLLLSKNTKQIAFALNISPRTVEAYVTKVKTKLQCDYKSDIVITAVRLGLVRIC